MPSKKVTFFLLFFCMLIFFGQSVLLSSIGTLAKIYLHYAKGWELSYSSLRWENRQIAFDDFSLNSPSYFSLTSPTVIASISQKHILVQNPHLIFKEIPQFSSQGSISWTCSMQDGIVEGLGLPQASFSFGKDPITKVASLQLEWEESAICVNTYTVEDKNRIYIDMNKIPLRYLSRWIGRQWSGTIHGSLQWCEEKDCYIAEKGCLEAIDIAYEGFCEGICGSLEWDGSLPLDWLEEILFLEKEEGFKNLYARNLDWEKILSEKWLRLNISQGKISDFDRVEMLFSLDGKSGAKWEISSLYENRDINVIGRGLIQGIKGPWMESELSFLDSSISIKGQQNEDRFLWEITAKALEPEILKLTHKLSSTFGGPTIPWICKEGLVEGSIQIFQNREYKWDWKVLDLSLKNFCVEGNSWLFSCKEAFLKNDAYVFSQGDFKLNDYWLGSEWSGDGDISKGIGTFSGKIKDHFFTCNWQGNFDEICADIKFQGVAEGDLSFSARRFEDALHFSVLNGQGKIFSFLNFDNLRMEGELNTEGLYCYDVRADCDLGKKILFFAPRIEIPGTFDIRLETGISEIARFSGTSDSKGLHLENSRSHWFSHTISFMDISLSSLGLQSIRSEFALPRKTMEFFFEGAYSLLHSVTFASLGCNFVYENSEVAIEIFGPIQYRGEKFDLRLHLTRKGNVWLLHPLQISDCTISGEMEIEKEGIQLTKGHGKISHWLEADFSGRFLNAEEWGFTLSRIRMDLQGLNNAKHDLRGILVGEGLIQWKGVLESDFDFSASQIQYNGWRIENQEPLHLFFSSEKGVSIRGLNASILHPDNLLAQNECKIGLMQYDVQQSFFTFTQAQLYVTSDLIRQIPLPKELSFSKDLLSLNDLHLNADIAFSSDYSHFSISVKESEIMLLGNNFHVQNFHLDKDPNDWKINFDLDHQMCWIPIDLTMHTDPGLGGRIRIENGMSLDWEYKDGFIIHAIDGRALGIDASFHLETDSLIGTAKVDCHRLKKVVPPEIAQVFYDLKMGDGYELMGRIYVDKDGVSFRGILSGKQFELAGFQFRNLLAQIELAKDHVYISDVKISDFAGVMKLDQIIARGEDGQPWTLSIPHLTITELRPSLLQEVGKPLGDLTPLVVRELKIEDIQGVLEDSKTYTGKGELYFINSYKREKSIFEFPSDILSRIVGLDLDLLIPVCGTLRYELRDGFFHFTELMGSYSENKRSEFFLVFNENSPKMDLDWNLNILIKMNQFVLFKFTESFIISIRGKLDNPKFQLQRKKRFLDLY